MAQQTFSGVPGDFTAGQVLTAADMDKLREFLLYLIKDGDETDTGEVSPVIMDLGNDRVGINEAAPASDLVVRADNGGGRGGEVSIINYATAEVANEAALNFGLDASTYAADLGNGQIKSVMVNTNGAADMHFSNHNGSSFINTVQFKAGGAVYQYASGQQLFLSANSPASLPATGASANMFFYSTNGAVYWNSSSVRHKTDIEDVEDAYADKVLDLTGRWGADVVVEVVGIPDVMPEGVRMLSRGGRYLTLGNITPRATYKEDPSILVGGNLVALVAATLSILVGNLVALVAATPSGRRS